MEGYSFKKDGVLKHFCADKKELHAILEKSGFVNYKKPATGSGNWVHPGDDVEYPYWGLGGNFGEVVKVKLVEA